MNATPLAQKRLMRQLVAIFADPRSWKDGVVPEEIKPYLGSYVSKALPPSSATPPAATPAKRQDGRPR